MSEIFQKIFVDPWPFWAGGIVIGLLVPLLYYFHNTALGVSTGYGNLVKIVFRPKGLRWIQQAVDNPFNWRMFFIVGIIGGAFLSARLSGSPLIITEMGRFTSAVNWPTYAVVAYFLVGGILLGLGARIAGGCTSGHSIHGIANLHMSSILATIMFLVGGAIAANIVRLLVSGGL
jgi:uncharacterized membrane protein YedE/YeeE